MWPARPRSAGWPWSTPNGATGSEHHHLLTAALASWFVEKLADVQAGENRTDAEITDLATEVHALREELAEMRHANAAARPGKSRGYVVRSVRKAL